MTWWLSQGVRWSTELFRTSFDVGEGAGAVPHERVAISALQLAVW